MLIALMSLLLLADPATGPDAAPKVRKPHMICKDEDAIGSLIAKRTCHTSDEWRDIARNADSRDARDDVAHAQLESTMHGPTGR